MTKKKPTHKTHRRAGKRSAPRVVESGDRYLNGKKTDRDTRGRFIKGGDPGPGRRRGSKNRIPVDARKAIHEALNAPPGAVSFLTKLRNSRVASDRAAFLHLVGKTIPRSIEADLSVAAEGPELVVVLPSNGRGPLPNETTEQYRARYEREVEARRDGNDSDGR
jgi:hypothetical protein